MNAPALLSSRSDSDLTLQLINVRYFAVFRERAGCSSESVYTGATTPLQLYRQLCGRHPLRLDAGLVKVSINSAFATWDARLQEGDVVVFIPPVAGG